MSNSKKIEHLWCFIRDDSSHWYCIPIEKKELFIELTDLFENDDANLDDCDTFEKEFNRYRLSYSLSSYGFILPAGFWKKEEEEK